MKKIMLDTNFLMACRQFNIDIFSEIFNLCNFNYKLYILDKTIEELKSIIDKQSGKSREAAKFGLKLIKFKKIGIIKTKGNSTADESILKKANKTDWIVATQDKILRDQLKKKHVPLIILRQKKRLIFEGKI